MAAAIGGSVHALAWLAAYIYGQYRIPLQDPRQVTIDAYLGIAVTVKKNQGRKWPLAGWNEIPGRDGRIPP